MSTVGPAERASGAGEGDLSIISQALAELSERIARALCVPKCAIAWGAIYNCNNYNKYY